ncbi:MAG TPA: zinc ribbon domain-containing protein [Thermoplasmata archaeon]|nr:zinc ribbon domain-containing protein [Thermoplasmata archaeon]
MASADGSTDRMCVSCGRSIAMDANVCQHCGHDFRAPVPVEKKKTILPVIGGALLIVTAVMGLFMGAMLLAVDVSELDQYGLDIAGDLLEDIMTVCGTIIIVLSLIVVLGGFFGVMRKHWGIAIVGGVLGLFIIGPMMIGSLLSLVGLILIAVSRKEFE